MAENTSTDLVMKFRRRESNGPGDYIRGESRTELNFTESNMTVGFSSGFLIELQSFTLGVSVEGTDNETRDKQKQHSETKKAANTQHENTMTVHRENNRSRELRGEPPLPDPKNPSAGLTKPDSGASFAKWRNGDKGAKYDPDVNPVEITRAIDRASPELLKLCIRREMLHSATLIKRKAAGGKTADGRDTSGEIFLRFDFEHVLITKVDWDEDDPVKEKVKFIARAVTMSYRPQLPNGNLGAVIPGFWTMAPGMSVFTLQNDR